MVRDSFIPASMKQAVAAVLTRVQVPTFPL